jgi:hypothetical protein
MAHHRDRASFLLKFQFVLEQRIDESQEMILNELKSGPYELVLDPEMKEIWKSKSSACSKDYFALTIHGFN